MKLQEAIHSRPSIGKVIPEPVDHTLIEQLLEAAVRAPNHYMTEPWRFFVMRGEGRKKLGQAYAAVAEAKLREEGREADPAELLAQEKKAYRAPVVIAVAVSPSDAPKVHRIEEFAAVHAAVQNMLLTAHALGLGAIWRTGDPTYHPLMKSAFGLADHEEMAGFIYIGYPETVGTRPQRTHFSEKTVWID